MDTAELNPDGNARLHELMRCVSNTEQVSAALGIQDVTTQDDEFWENQRRAARRRFLCLCLQQLGWDLATEPAELDSGQAHVVADEAARLLEDGTLTYSTVRQWYLNRGQFEFSSAIHRRRESKRLQDLQLRVLLVLEAGGAKYLAHGAGITDLRLVDSAKDAFTFPVRSVSELEPDYLAAMARHFDTAKATFAAKQVKILAARKS